MKYIEMFGDLSKLKCGKPTKERYKKIVEFIKNKEIAKMLDDLKIPNWYVLRFIESTQYRISFSIRQINVEQKFNLFIKSLDDVIITRYKEKTLLWKLKEFNMDVGDYIRNYTQSTITAEEKEIIKEKAKIHKANLEEEIKKFREKYGDPFKEFREKFGIGINNYEILGLKNGASKEDIKKSYRKLCKKHHPDLGGNVEEFRKINEAYKKLCLN